MVFGTTHLGIFDIINNQNGRATQPPEEVFLTVILLKVIHMLYEVLTLPRICLLDWLQVTSHLPGWHCPDLFLHRCSPGSLLNLPDSMSQR